MTASRPDQFDYVNAFRAGFRHGQDVGIVSPREAESALRDLPTSIPVTADTVDLFCNGADDGARGDTFRYALSFATRPTAQEPP